jgi:hypothetical protein
MAGASARAGRPAGRGGPAAWWSRLFRPAGRLSKVFARDPAGLNWARAVAVLDLALVPLVLFWAIGHEEYLPSALFGLLLSVLADPGGGLGYRAWHIAVFGLAGAGMTALGFGLVGDAWGWLVLAAFAVTLVAGLAAAFGVHRFVAALLLNLWLVIALGLGAGLQRQAHGAAGHTWAQVLAWAGGSALWIAVAGAERLVRERQGRRPLVAEIPGGTSRKRMSPPLVAFALIRAVAVAGTVALAFGLDLSHGYWMPIAAIVAMRPSLLQSTLVAAQRLTGAVIGAVAAALLLLIPASEHGLRLFATERGLEVVALVLLVHAVAVRFWNYALYCAAVAAGVLVLVDLPQPSHYAAEGYRVLWTLCGVGFGVATMLLAGLLGRRGSKASPRPD